MYKYLPSVRQSICDIVLVDIDLIMFHHFSGMLKKIGNQLPLVKNKYKYTRDIRLRERNTFVPPPPPVGIFETMFFLKAWRGFW